MTLPLPYPGRWQHSVRRLHTDSLGEGAISGGRGAACGCLRLRAAACSLLPACCLGPPGPIPGKCFPAGAICPLIPDADRSGLQERRVLVSGPGRLRLRFASGPTPLRLIDKTPAWVALLRL